MGITAHRSLDNRRLYSCDGPGCGLSREPWGASWLYYASIAEIEDNPESLVTWCSRECAERYIDANPRCGIPKPTDYDLKSDMGKTLQRMADAPLHGGHNARALKPSSEGA